MLTSAATAIFAVILTASASVTSGAVLGGATGITQAVSATGEVDGAGAEWVISSSDTFGDAIDAAVEKQGTEKVAAALGDMADRASVGGSIDFPGLDDLSSAQVASLTDAASTAVEDKTALPPAVDALPLDSAAGTTNGPAKSSATVVVAAVFNPASFHANGASFAQQHATIIPAGVAGGGLYWQYNGWIQRGVTDGKGGVTWTDRLNWDGRVDPGAVTSRLNYNVRQALDHGFFSSWGMESRVSQKKIGWDQIVAATGKQGISAGSRTDYMTNDPRMNGESILFTTEFSAKGRDGNTWSDQLHTDYAACQARSAGNVCRW